MIVYIDTQVTYLEHDREFESKKNMKNVLYDLVIEMRKLESKEVNYLLDRVQCISLFI